MKPNFSQIRGILDTQGEVGFFLLVQLDLNNVYFYTTLPYQVIYDGNAYNSEDCIIEVMPPTNTTVVNRNAYSIKLSGLDSALVSEIKAHIINSKVTLRMGFTVDGEARLNTNETMHVYSGYVSKPRYEVNGEEVAITLELTSPLADLDGVSTLLTTRDAMKNFDPADTSFDELYEGSSATNLKWGKA